MGGKPKRVDTSAMDAQLARQEQLLREQEARIAAREAEVKAQEEVRRRVRQDRWRGRALLLGGGEMGTEDQPMPARLQRLLGG